MTIEEIALKYWLCNCAEIYTSRGLTAPDCPYHAFCVEEAMEEYAKQEAIGFSIWMKENSCREGQDLWTCRFTRWKERHTISELYDLFQQQKQK